MADGAVVLDSTAVQLGAVVAREQVSARAPSLVSGVVRDGRLIWWQGRGRTVRRGADREADSDTQYRIGSITKTMTAILVMQLRDEGKLDLGDQLGRHLPDAPYGDVSLRMLLCHAAGLPAEPAGPWWERSPGRPYADLLSGAPDLSRPLPAGQQHHYSNLAYALLGELVARHRASSWWEAATTHLLRPLRMQRTSYDQQEPAAEGYSVDAFGGTLIDEPHHDSKAMAPAGQLWSTVADLGRYAAFLIAPDAEVLTPESVQEMATVQSGTPEDGLAGGYGVGLRLLNSSGRTLIGHTGSMPGFLAGLFVDRETRSGAVCLANSTAGLRCEGLPADLLSTLEDCEPALPDAWTPLDRLPSDVGDLVGLWYWGETALVSSYDAGHLLLTRADYTRAAHRFRRDGPDSFTGVAGYHTGEALRVVRKANGSVWYLECATFVYTRSPYDASAPIPGGAPRRVNSPD